MTTRYDELYDTRRHGMRDTEMMNPSTPFELYGTSRAELT